MDPLPAVVTIFTSIAGSPYGQPQPSSPAGPTLQTVGTPTGTGFRRLTAGPGWPLVVRVEDVHPFIGSAHRPHETLSTQGSAALVKRVNGLAGPYTGRQFDFVLCTGDNTDNHETIELEWFLTVLNGGTVTPTCTRTRDSRSSLIEADSPHSADFGDGSPAGLASLYREVAVNDIHAGLGRIGVPTDLNTELVLTKPF